MPPVEERATERFLYFAYGSNMQIERLLERTPSARACGTGCVTMRRLRFHKTSDDGSGKCDMELTDDVNDHVDGVLFRIALAQKPALDRAEGLNRGYEEVMVDVVIAGGTVRALAYVARAGATDATRRPYHWYKALVVAGAIQHGLAADYIAQLRGVGSLDDPLPSRRTKREAEAALTASGIVVD